MNETKVQTHIDRLLRLPWDEAVKTAICIFGTTQASYLLCGRSDNPAFRQQQQQQN